ncbi:PadR family transcriptional regulator [Anaeromicropila herbilytica]|uniref:Transcriptional regulator n=1 Tax=Anaeromicropila herbilytica TaxID=2785025 RepID=A0A7R7IEH0_9FIRM|nr:PadR family transcriptional regulator [Anaeromicropila herbilytica]BCN32703.1 transcriptional regulator [Anaeromicropila herbilytica]
MENNFSPMSETAYYILLSLLEERHGYGIMQYVASITSNRINIGAGTIYGTLGKLEKGKMIITTREEDKRKYYQITDEGKEVLQIEIKRLEELYQNGMEALNHEK